MKYSGLFTSVVILGVITADYWTMVGDRGVSNVSINPLNTPGYSTPYDLLQTGYWKKLL